MALPGIVIQIGADTKDAIDGIGRVNSALGDSMSGHAKFKASVDKAFVPAMAIIAGGTAVALDFAKAAAEDSASAAQLAVTMKNVTGATANQVAAVEDWISKQTIATGIADDQLRPAYQRLVGTYKNLEDAKRAVTIAEEIAINKNVDVTTVANAMAKAHDGNTGALKKLGIVVNDTSPLLDQLGTQFKGSLAADAEEAEGKQRRLTNSLAEAKETLGYALLPALSAVTGALAGMVPWISENQDIIGKVVIVVGAAAAGIVVLKGAIVAWETVTKAVTIAKGLMALATGAQTTALVGETAATGAATVAQTGLNTALMANPLGLVVIAVAAFVAAVVVAYNKVDWFRDGVNTAWAFIKKAFSIGIEFVQGLWDKFIGALDMAKRFFSIGADIVAGVRNGIANAWEGLKNWFGNKVSGLVDGVKNLLGINSPSRVFASIGSNIVAGFAQGVSGLADVNASVLDSTTQLVRNLPTVNDVTTSSSGSAPAATGASALVTEDQIARAIQALLMRADMRTGRTVAVI